MHRGLRSVWLEECAQKRREVQVIAQIQRTPAEAFNVAAKITGTYPTLPPLVVMTPRSPGTGVGYLLRVRRS